MEHFICLYCSLLFGLLQACKESLQCQFSHGCKHACTVVHYPLPQLLSERFNILIITSFTLLLHYEHIQKYTTLKASCVYEHCWHNLLAYLKTNTRKGIPLFMLLPVWCELDAVEASFKSFWHIKTLPHKLHIIFSPCGIIFPSALMNQALSVTRTAWLFETCKIECNAANLSTWLTSFLISRHAVSVVDLTLAFQRRLLLMFC